jgi:hypothetical protein
MRAITIIPVASGIVMALPIALRLTRPMFRCARLLMRALMLLRPIGLGPIHLVSIASVRMRDGAERHRKHHHCCGQGLHRDSSKQPCGLGLTIARCS